jgi:hypothetical protein
MKLRYRTILSSRLAGCHAFRELMVSVEAKKHANLHMPLSFTVNRHMDFEALKNGK